MFPVAHDRARALAFMSDIWLACFPHPENRVGIVLDSPSAYVGCSSPGALGYGVVSYSCAKSSVASRRIRQPTNSRSVLLSHGVDPCITSGEILHPPQNCPRRASPRLRSHFGVDNEIVSCGNARKEIADEGDDREPDTCGILPTRRVDIHLGKGDAETPDVTYTYMSLYSPELC